MLTWALADRLKDTAVTANALNPGYVLTDLTTNVGGPTQDPDQADKLRGSDGARRCGHCHLARGQPELEGVTGKFWNKRRQVRCRFRHPEEVEHLWTLVEQQTGQSETSPVSPVPQ